MLPNSSFSLSKIRGFNQGRVILFICCFKYSPSCRGLPFPGTPCSGAKSYFSTFNPARAPGECWAPGLGAARARLAVACALAAHASPSLLHLPAPCLGRMTGKEKAAASVPVCMPVGGRRKGLAAEHQVGSVPCL